MEQPISSRNDDFVEFVETIAGRLLIDTPDADFVLEYEPVSYTHLTSFGKSIIPVLEAMCSWGEGYLKSLDMQNSCASSKKQ